MWKGSLEHPSQPSSLQTKSREVTQPVQGHKAKLEPPLPNILTPYGPTKRHSCSASGLGPQSCPKGNSASVPRQMSNLCLRNPYFCINSLPATGVRCCSAEGRHQRALRTEPSLVRTAPFIELPLHARSFLTRTQVRNYTFWMSKQRGAARCVQADAKKTAAQKPIWGDCYCYLTIMAMYYIFQCARHWVGILEISYFVRSWACYLTTLCLSFLICKMVPTLGS